MQKRSTGAKAEIRVRVTHSRSGRRRFVLSGRLAGWLDPAAGGREGCMVAAPARSLGSSFTAHADRLTTRPTQLARIILLVLISLSLMRNGAKHLPLGVLGRQGSWTRPAATSACRRRKAPCEPNAVRRTVSGECSAPPAHLPFANPRAFQLIQHRRDDNAERTAAPN
jgi:hypothetical protein